MQNLLIKYSIFLIFITSIINATWQEIIQHQKVPLICCGASAICCIGWIIEYRQRINIELKIASILIDLKSKNNPESTKKEEPDFTTPSLTSLSEKISSLELEQEKVKTKLQHVAGLAQISILCSAYSNKRHKMVENHLLTLPNNLEKK